MANLFKPTYSAGSNLSSRAPVNPFQEVGALGKSFVEEANKKELQEEESRRWELQNARTQESHDLQKAEAERAKDQRDLTNRFGAYGSQAAKGIAARSVLDTSGIDTGARAKEMYDATVKNLYDSKDETLTTLDSQISELETNLSNTDKTSPEYQQSNKNLYNLTEQRRNYILGAGDDEKGDVDLREALMTPYDKMELSKEELSKANIKALTEKGIDYVKAKEIADINTADARTAKEIQESREAFAKALFDKEKQNKKDALDYVKVLEKFNKTGGSGDKKSSGTSKAISFEDTFKVVEGVLNEGSGFMRSTAGTLDDREASELIYRRVLELDPTISQADLNRVATAALLNAKNDDWLGTSVTKKDLVKGLEDWYKALNEKKALDKTNGSKSGSENPYQALLDKSIEDLKKKGTSTGKATNFRDTRASLFESTKDDYLAQFGKDTKGVLMGDGTEKKTTEEVKDSKEALKDTKPEIEKIKAEPRFITNDTGNPFIERIKSTSEAVKNSDTNKESSIKESFDEAQKTKNFFEKYLNAEVNPEGRDAGIKYFKDNPYFK